MIDKEYVKDVLIKDINWHKGHGAYDDFLGCGMMYYALTYMLRAKTCVCIGSGGGFVPQLMRQAQIDLKLEDSITVLIDSNEVAEYPDCPRWLNREDPNYKFIENFDVDIITDRFENVIVENINYLHIDADHSYDGTMAAFEKFNKYINKYGIITLHDIGHPDDVIMPCGKKVGVPQAYRDIIKNTDWRSVSFPEIGGGLAILKKELPATVEKTSPHYLGWRMNRKEGT